MNEANQRFLRHNHWCTHVRIEDITGISAYQLPVEITKFNKSVDIVCRLSKCGCWWSCVVFPYEKPIRTAWHPTLQAPKMGAPSGWPKGPRGNPCQLPSAAPGGCIPEYQYGSVSKCQSSNFNREPCFQTHPHKNCVWWLSCWTLPFWGSFQVAEDPLLILFLLGISTISKWPWYLT